jgi:cell division protein FtsW
MTEHASNADSTQKKKRFQLESPYRISIPMLILTLILVCFGLIMLFSASMAAAYNDANGNPLYYVLKQGGFTLIGIVIACVIVFIPVKWYDRIGFVIFAYILTLGLVIYTKFKGIVVGGSRRWIMIGSQTFQPSELAKIALIFCIAGYRSFVIRLRKSGKLVCKTARGQSYLDCIVDIVFPVTLLMICLIIVFLQPHMSFFIIMLILSLICFLVSGIPLKSWIDGGLIIIAVTLLVCNVLILSTNFAQQEKFMGNFEHVFTRLSIFSTLNGEDTANSSDTGNTAAATDANTATDDEVYQSEQSMIAIGSGGASGVGFGNSRQKYQYLPAAHNDYVFAIACEELGFVGGVSIIVLFWAFLCGGLSIAWRAQSDFARILVVGYTCLIVVQAAFNIAVSIGVVPPTGITLPFFSYGGTANLFFLIAVGVILAVSRTGVSRKKITYID